jgi:hypothetical protein
MNPEDVLTMLIQAHRHPSVPPSTPFLLRRAHPALPSLSHPIFPEGSFSVDAEIEDALQTLVQWGYLAQPEQLHGQAYLLTPAGLSYAARRDGRWDGTERRQVERRSSGRRPLGNERRQVERRTS